MSEHVETDRDKGNKDVIKKEAFQYKLCTGTVYRRIDENLKICNLAFGWEVDIHAFVVGNLQKILRSVKGCDMMDSVQFMQNHIKTASILGIPGKNL